MAGNQMRYHYWINARGEKLISGAAINHTANIGKKND